MYKEIKRVCVCCKKTFVSGRKTAKYCSKKCLWKKSPVRVHGEAGKSLLYYVWKNIKQRCYNPKNPSYKYYGLKGVSMCSEWENDYLVFKNFMLSNGYKKGLQIDRINVFGNYEPKNCRVVEQYINARNKRNTEKITAFGETKTFSEWLEDERCKTTFSSFWHRVKRGWSVGKALETPLTFIRK